MRIKCKKRPKKQTVIYERGVNLADRSIVDFGLAFGHCCGVFTLCFKKRSLGKQAGQYCDLPFITLPVDKEYDFLSDMSKDKSF